MVADAGAPTPNPTRSKARFRRMAVLLGWWAILLVGLLLLVAGGPWWLVLPVGVVGVLVLSNTIVIIRHTGPEETALEPGRLRAADAARDDGVAVWATRSPRHGARERSRRSGTLAYVGGRLSFTVDPSPEPRAGRRGRTGDDPLADVAVLDAPVRRIELAARPTPLRPALVLSHDGTRHVFELAPQFDLGAGAVGAVVSGAWWDQLSERGARTPGT